MRTAEETLSLRWDFKQPLTKENRLLHILQIKEAMKDYAKEAIEECAKRVQQNFNLTVDKESILSLKKELT